MSNIYISISSYETAIADQHADKLKGVLHYAQNLTRDMLVSIRGESVRSIIDVNTLSDRILNIEKTVLNQYQRYAIASAAAGEPNAKRAEIVSRVMNRLFDVYDHLDAAMKYESAQTTRHSL